MAKHPRSLASKKEAGAMTQRSLKSSSVTLKSLLALAKKAGITDFSKVSVTMAREYNPHAADWEPYHLILKIPSKKERARE